MLRFQPRPQRSIVTLNQPLALVIAALLLPACSDSPAGPAAVGGSSNTTAGAATTPGGTTSVSGATNGGAPSGGTSGGTSGSNAGVGGTSSTPTGGSAGSAGQSAGSGGGSSVALIVSDDFEATSGTTPDVAKWSVFNAAATGENANTVSVSTEQAHSGTHSVKVAVKSAGAMLMTKVGLPPASGALYYRMWARFVNGAASTATWQPHVTFVEAGGLLDNGDVDQGDEARLGGQAGKIAANLSKGDGLSPNPYSMPCTPCADPPVSDKWVCLEGLFDGKNNKTAAWLDGVQVVKADSPTDWHSASTYPAALERIGFGWEAYGAVANTVYYDDIAVSTERINCD
jgi:hypothetical protein